MRPSIAFASRLAVVGATLLLTSDASVGQQVWEIPPRTLPPSSQLFPGDIINLRDGGVLDSPFYSPTEPPGYTIPSGVELNAFGGHLSDGTNIGPAAIANLYGGSKGDAFSALLGSQVYLHGADFAIDGVPVDGLDTIGDQATPALADGQLLTGRLSDGTPFAFSSLDWGIVDADPFFSPPHDPPATPSGDSFAHGALTLVLASTLDPVPGELVAQPNDPLRFIDGAQSLAVNANGRVGANFVAGPGAAMTVNASPCFGFGCTPAVGDNFEAIGATVTLDAGSIAGDADLFQGAQLTVNGGTVGPNLQVHRDSQLLVQGGEVLAGLKIMPGGVATLVGGTVSQATNSPYYYPTSESVSVYGGGELAIGGGLLSSPLELLPGGRATQSAGTVTGRMTLSAGAEFSASGGHFGDVAANSASTLRLVGDGFSVDGTPVAELGGVGDAQQINLPSGAVLTGVLADGRPFVISSQDDSLAAGTLWLERSAAPSPGAPEISVPTDPAPDFVVGGQTVTVNAGGQLPNFFAAGPGSVVNVDAGSIGSNAEFAGAEVNVVGGGRLGSSARAYRGTTLTVNDGRIGSNSTAYDGSVVDVLEGQVLNGFNARSGSQITVRAGYVGGDFDADVGAQVELTGYDFKLDGLPVAGLATVGDAIGVDLGAGQLLTGVLADGTSFAFHSDDSDQLAAGTLTLRRTDAPESGPAAISVPSDAAPVAIRAGQTLTLEDGGELADYFVAGDGSRLVVEGGRVRNYAEAINAEVEVNSGEVGVGFSAFNSVVDLNGGEFSGTVDLFHGSTLTMTGGLIDASVNVYRGARLAASGGGVEGSLSVRQSANATINAATIDGEVYAYANADVEIGGRSRVEGVSAYSGSRVTLAGGSYEDNVSLSSNSTLTLRGSGFRLNGAPIDDLVAVGGKLGELDILTGVFADGTPFALTERRGFSESLGSGYLVLTQEVYAQEAGDYTAASLPNPLGVHAGQSVTVFTGQSLGPNFNAGYGSTVVVDGGELGENFEAAGAVVSLSSGQIADDADLLHHTTATVTGGAIGNDLFVAPKATLHLQGGELGRYATVFGVLDVSGGEVDRDLTVESGGRVEVSDGLLGDYTRVENGGLLELNGGAVGRYLDVYGDALVSGGTVDRGADVWSGGELTLDGGAISTDLNIRSNGRLRVSGGTLAAGIDAQSGSAVDLFAAGFALDGLAIDGLQAPGDSRVLSARQGELLELTFADGTTESFTLNASGSSSGDVFSPQAVLTLHLVAAEAMLAGDFNQDGVVDAADYTVWRDHLGDAAGALANDPTGESIGQSQYELWRSNYGANFSPAATGHAPEPAVMAMLLLAGAATATLQRGRRI
ncbi:hypothetical protein KOR34_03710 [Posidoniimonas corsicana]|uniref:Autotransporter-associated beta strand repeat protein n=1 Tax=Posidoniimonas corsicana TaxID=1938618 RepID=A0A5C5VCD5_9BACT|nr:hypothetical protein [Posidoniimonas corsicana]TWT35479.1 hypothetical protein KOR34_03710 [Posidoniimonas corsicana]